MKCEYCNGLGKGFERVWPQTNPDNMRMVETHHEDGRVIKGMVGGPHVCRVKCEHCNGTGILKEMEGMK